MSDPTFRAMIVREGQDGRFTREVSTRSVEELPDGDVLIAVRFSSLNYKDALSATGNKGVTRTYPHTPGIDAAGVVAQSRDARFPAGAPVLVTGYDLGMNTPGGFAEYIRVPADWVVPCPAGLTLEESMIYGTAGFTAALSVHELRTRVHPGDGEVLVTGASGGVGSLAVGILAKAGYRVVAVTGKSDAESFLKDLGAVSVVGREECLDQSGKPLLRERWAGAIDTVGGDILATVLKSTRYGGAVTCCGLVASPKLETTVFPFILRGIRLLGIDSVNCPMPLRQEIWNKMSAEWRPGALSSIAMRCSLQQLGDYIPRILKGAVRGRILVDLAR